MKIQSLTLAKLVDIVYACGMDETPVSVIIGAPPGSGKTWATQSISESNRVTYLNTSSSPNEHRKTIIESAPRTSLLINDDIGYFATHKDEYYATFGMIVDGRISHTMWKTTQTAPISTSLVLCCTDEQFFDNRDAMKASGLLSRLVPFIVGISKETRKGYQKSILGADIRRNGYPPQRTPTRLKRGKPHDELISECDVDPRLLTNIRAMSQYMTEEQTYEVIQIAHSKKKEWEI